MAFLIVALLLLISQANWTITFYLHDAVYLYLRTVNQTLANGYRDYRDGHLILDKTIGQRFAGRHRSFTVSHR